MSGIDVRLPNQFVPLLVVDCIRDEQAGQERAMDQITGLLQVIGRHDLWPYEVSHFASSPTFPNISIGSVLFFESRIVNLEG